ncbi:MAG: TIGR04282 family arsenosugar biosynthesis glycosyltransferase [Gemmatimonadales bacterium]
MPRRTEPRALGIFVKAPIPGRVKTRLAEEIGAVAAAELYRRLGRQVVAAARGRGSSHHTTVWFTPAAEEAVVREWLEGVARVELRAQTGESLGDRLSNAFAHEFAEGAGRAVIIGSDCPGVDRRLVAEAFGALNEDDVVLGPALDGGYYLIGLSRPEPALFRDISWSTARVADQTRARAHALGLSCHLLRPLRDVDTLEDARALGLQ